MILSDMFARMTMGRALILGFTLTALYYFILFDDGGAQKGMLDSVATQVEQAKTELSQTQKKIDRALEYQRATAELGQSIKRLLEFLPSGFRIGQFMKTVSTEARIAGMQINRVTPSPSLEASNVPEFNELGVTVELKGQFNQVLKMMSSLTQKNQIFIYQNLKMSSAEDASNENGQITVTADIRAYDYIGDTKPPGAEDAQN